MEFQKIETPHGYVVPYKANPPARPYYPVEKCKVSLKNKGLWWQFHRLQTEMIITKSGRRMFPALHVEVADLDPKASYCVFLEMALESHCRHKYSSSVGWTPAGNEEAQSPNRLYMHPQSPSSGEHWMSQNISFSRVKLTNTSIPPQGHLVLSSMHRYQPRVLIVQTTNPNTLSWSPSKVVIFPETQFVAVTAYQNEKITKLKIDHNPFAKGFRENGKSSTNKRKHSEIEQEINVVDVDDTQPIEIQPQQPQQHQQLQRVEEIRTDDVRSRSEGEPLMYTSRMPIAAPPSVVPSGPAVMPPGMPMFAYYYPPTYAPLPMYPAPIWPQHVPIMYHHPLDHTRYHQYPTPSPPIMTPSPQHYEYDQQYQSQPQDLSTSQAIVKPAAVDNEDDDDKNKNKSTRTVTDFSIRKITGCC